MKYKGTIQWIGERKTGVSKNSGKEWSTQEFVVSDTTARYPEGFVFSVFNKDIDASVGDEVEVEFDGNAHEYNGRWFNDLRAFRIINLSGGKEEPQQTEQPQTDLFAQQMPKRDNELPF